MSIFIKKQTLKLNSRQIQQADLYARATGKVIIYINKGKPKVLNPDKIVEFSADRFLLDKIQWTGGDKNE